MTYATTLATKFGKRSVWLYEFTVGGVTTRLCSGVSNYTDGNAVTWTASPVTHSRFSVTASINRAETEIIFPQSDTFARTYLVDQSYAANTVVIYHEFRNKSPEERVVKFRGRVIGTRPMFTRLILVAENNFTEARRKALHPIIQQPCRHALYHQSADGYGCPAILANFQTAGTMTSFSTGVATVAAASAEADGYYNGGVFEWNSLYQMIVSHTGDYLTLLGPVAGMEAAVGSSGSEAVNIAPGCDRTRATCNSVFNALDDQGGFAWIDESPFDGKTLF